MRLKLQDLIDIDHFQNLQNRLNEIYLFPSAIIDNEGNILTATAWQDVCSQFHRKNKECEHECIKSDQYILDHIHEANPAVSYRCPHGLVDNATPIVIEGVHYGNFFTGQFFLEEPDLDFFRGQAKKYGFKEDAYIEAVKRVPVWTQKQLDNYLFFIKGLIAVIAESGLKKLKEIENRKQIEKSELKYRTLFEKSTNAIFLVDKTTGSYLDANAAALELTGYTLAEIRNRKTKELTPDGAEKRLNTIMTSDESLELGEVVYHRKDGLKRVAMLSVVPLNENIVFGIVQDITKHKQASEALRESEKKYRQLTQTMLETLSVIDLNGVILYANRNAALSLSSGNSDDITGKNIRQLLPKNQAEQIIGQYKEVYASNEPYFQEILIHLKKGDAWFSNTLKPINFGPAEIPAVLSVSLDITERKQAEQNYQMLFREMLEGFALHEIICDEDGYPVNYRFLAINPAFEKLTGLKADQVIGRNVLEVLPDIEPFWIETYGNVALSGEPAFFENYSSSIGRHFQVTAFRPSPGQFACIFVDITERHAAENELRESEEKFRNFTEQSFVGFYIIQDEVFKYVNPKFSDIFGYSVDECLNDMHFRQLVHTEDLATVQEQVRRRVAGEIESSQYTIRGVKKTGEIIHVSIYGSSLIYQGRPAAIGTMLDITKELELEKRVAQSQRMEAIGSLAGGIAHDFNNILFPIVGLSEMLMDDLPLDSPEHENAVEIFNAGKRGSDLVKQILAFSRQSEQKKMPIRVQQILKEVMKLSRSTIPVNISITQDIQNECGLVQADPTQVHQIAMNLITNAYHAVEPKSGEISVQLKEVDIRFGQLPEGDLLPGRYALLSVSDTGIGIDPAIRDKIFEPYFTTKEQGKGTGLGLAVVYGIVKEHQGDIRVTSELGKGTMFKVYLPIMAQAERIPSVEENADSLVGHEHILLVDDEEAIAKLEKQMLERLGYKVTMRVNSLEALQAFKNKPGSFDLVISDMTMPNMTGDMLAREVMAIRPNIPIIICTGFSERLDQEKAAIIGIKGFLLKPIIKSDMGKIVRKVLDETKKRS